MCGTEVVRLCEIAVDLLNLGLYVIDVGLDALALELQPVRLCMQVEEVVVPRSGIGLKFRNAFLGVGLPVLDFVYVDLASDDFRGGQLMGLR